MRVVVDTNVVVSGLIFPDSPPGRVLDAARRGEIELVVSWELVAEAMDVLTRPKLRRYEVDPEAIEILLRFLAPELPRVELDVATRDPDDAPVVAAALAGGADAIITGDRDLLDDQPLREWLADRGVSVLSPAELLARLDG